MSFRHQVGGNRVTISAAEYFVIASGGRQQTSTHSGTINPTRIGPYTLVWTPSPSIDYDL
jgi:hypothetical protein